MVDCELKFSDLSLSYTSVNRARSHATHSQVKFLMVSVLGLTHYQLYAFSPAPVAWSEGSHSRLTAAEVCDVTSPSVNDFMTTHSHGKYRVLHTVYNPVLS